MNFAELAKRIKNKQLWVLAVAASLILLTFAAAFFTKRCYAVEVDNKEIAIVYNKSSAKDIIRDIIHDSEKKLGFNLKVSSKISFKSISAFGRKATPAAVLKEKLEDNIQLMAEAYSINVDGKDIAFLKDRSSAEAVLNRVRETYQKNNEASNAEDIGFLEDVKVMPKDAEISSLQDEDAVFSYIMDGGQSIKKYIVNAGDTISEIAERFKIKQADIEKANPGINIDRIQIGQEINLSVPKYVINIKTVETVTYEKAVPYDVKYEETSTLYKGQMKVKANGREGKKIVTAEIIKVNGIISDENILSENVIEQPVTKLILKGIKERPRTLAYGEFHMPSRGSITSRFGKRWGSMHTGIDIGVPIGTPVKAADGGKVIFSGWKGSYGKLVIIDHENGYTTYYGHCSQLKVKTGQRVARDEVIAASGDTGNVTGPHLHFEVRKNGVAVNPLKYLN